LGAAAYSGPRMFPLRTTGVIVIALAAVASTACGRTTAALTQLVEARRLASALHVDFTRAADASNRAVMADTDEASAAAAEEARGARQAVEGNVDMLRGILQSLGYDNDLGALEAFAARFAEYRKVDEEILPLAVENTNLKAQRLSLVRRRKPPTRSAPRSKQQPIQRRGPAAVRRSRTERARPCSRSRSSRRRTSPSRTMAR
jgi:hypothetical protein